MTQPPESWQQQPPIIPGTPPGPYLPAAHSARPAPTPEQRAWTNPAPPPAAKRKSKVPLVLGIIGAVLVVLCGGAIACTALVGNAVNDTANPVSKPGGGDAAAVGLNQPARDGKFEFVVSAVKCGITSVGTLAKQKAQGQFCKVTLTVKNIGDVPQSFFGANQYAFNASGQKYETDGAAAIYLEEDSNSLWEDINPGNAVQGVLLFDIPKGASIVRLELHDSAFSGGVGIKV